MKKTLKNQFQEVTVTVTSYSLDPYNFFRQMFLAKFYSDVKPLGTPSVCPELQIGLGIRTTWHWKSRPWSAFPAFHRASSAFFPEGKN
jgi:hypothetical protein